MNQPSRANRKALSFLLILPVLVLSACQRSAETRQARETSAAKSDKASVAVSQTPDVEIFVDEAMLRKPHAVLGGTLKNVGTEKLENLSLELELIRRDDGSAVRREIAVEPRELAPGGSAKYSIKVLSDEWSGSRIISLRNASARREIAFRTLPGARRPPEKTTSVTRVIQDSRPRSTSKGEEFINTPDTATSVP
ncbi:MAG TPA: hypothetical protein VFS10_15230 [Pyrinomonadaceae bacterium]|nr:hypothetical protein [Pyrinomonadaceae bacterium]